jgi:hypothetical protein
MRTQGDPYRQCKESNKSCESALEKKIYNPRAKKRHLLGVIAVIMGHPHGTLAP